MKKKITLILSTSFAIGFAALSAAPVCHKCEVIREHNAQTPNKYEYYEDYLKDHPEANQSRPQEQEEQQVAPKKAPVVKKPAPKAAPAQQNQQQAPKQK